MVRLVPTVTLPDKPGRLTEPVFPEIFIAFTVVKLPVNPSTTNT